ncbi:putative 7-carboxy-7-deazaguanine synthase QueE [Anaerotignum sp.]|uniref:putative 7-carboxy-7-deazaguanine synthase QueE n=1 Tax=Anaerotignum sp. TaxID=2039241 RepID=UPI0027148438|nr:putative 7-carboxy-7-deazaguanine synthase QueE [Anaerotignum sp.]
MSQYKVVEKFVSINGEGVFAGQLAVFIRFQGCNLNCSYCDTAWANKENTTFTIMTEDQIYHYIKETGIKNVTLTGGEPLLNPEMIQLLQVLAGDSELHVEIETNGSIDLSIFTQIRNPPTFTMDYKLPGSFMESKMLISNFRLLTKKDTVKFVVGDIEDLDCAREIITRNQLISKCHVYISTVFGKISLDEVVEYMKKNTMNGITLQLQMHKIIWDPNRRGV